MQEEVTLPQACARLALAYPVVYRLAMTGELGPLRQTGGHWRLLYAGLEAYLARQRGGMLKPANSLEAPQSVELESPDEPTHVTPTNWKDPRTV